MPKSSSAKLSLHRKYPELTLSHSCLAGGFSLLADLLKKSSLRGTKLFLTESVFPAPAFIHTPLYLLSPHAWEM